MNTAIEYASAASAARDFFGDKGTGAVGWMKEWRELNDADKAEIATGLRQNGYQIKV